MREKRADEIIRKINYEMCRFRLENKKTPTTVVMSTSVYQAIKFSLNCVQLPLFPDLVDGKVLQPENCVFGMKIRVVDTDDNFIMVGIPEEVDLWKRY